ncbi:MAG: hypothetical protein KAQ71_09360 [Desulfobulbaceae bacterium]|nr:hypothetical protein [Desulfobulbaceae bacterium]
MKDKPLADCKARGRDMQREPFSQSLSDYDQDARITMLPSWLPPYIIYNKIGAVRYLSTDEKFTEK